MGGSYVIDQAATSTAFKKRPPRCPQPESRCPQHPATHPTGALAVRKPLTTVTTRPAIWRLTQVISHVGYGYVTEHRMARQTSGVWFACGWRLRVHDDPDGWCGCGIAHNKITRTEIKLGAVFLMAFVAPYVGWLSGLSSVILRSQAREACLGLKLIGAAVAEGYRSGI